MLLVIVAAVLLRFPQLEERVMHGDEAVNAVRFAQLWQEGTYRYDPDEYHGPTLPYLTLPLAWLSPATTFAETSESMYRLVAAVFGVILVGLTLGAWRTIGPVAALVAGALVALSPAMSFYSRYYIHEVPLVVFTFAAILAGWRYAVTRRAGWAVTCGVMLGLMHATKETCIISWFAMAVALGAAVLWSGRISGREVLRPRAWMSLVRPAHLAAGLLAAAVVSATLFSSFFTHPRGPIDSILTYWTWIGRGVGVETPHVQPWHWYLSLLAYHRDGLAPAFSEGLIVGLAAIGFVAACLGRGVTPLLPPSQRAGVRVESPDAPESHPAPTSPNPSPQADRPRVDLPFIRFLAIYTLVMVLVYSTIPYKTPWTMLGFFHGITLLAGVGAVAIAHWLATALRLIGPARLAMPAAAALVGAALLAGLWNLTGQARLANFRMHTDRRNPYVYSHPGRDVRRFARRAEQLATVHPDGRAMVIHVIEPGYYWPLPFYLRAFPNVGYHAAVPGPLDAPIIVANPQLVERVEAAHAAEYRREYLGLRPGDIPRLVYIRQDLWDRYVDSRRSADSDH